MSEFNPLRARPISLSALGGRCTSGESPWRRLVVATVVTTVTAISTGCPKTPEPNFPGIDPAAARKAKATAAAVSPKPPAINPQAAVGASKPPATSAPLATDPATKTGAKSGGKTSFAPGAAPQPTLRPTKPLPDAKASPLPGRDDLAKLEGMGGGFSDPIKAGNIPLFTAMDRALSAVYVGSRTEDKAMRLKRSANGVVVLATVIEFEGRPYAYDLRVLYANRQEFLATEAIGAATARDVQKALALLPGNIGLEVSADIGEALQDKPVKPRVYKAPAPFSVFTRVQREGAENGLVSAVIRLGVSSSTPPVKPAK